MIKCNLAILMAERRLSIQDVADKSGLSRTTISALVNENGKGIQFETMDVLCELLGVSPGALFSHALIKTEFTFTIGEFHNEEFQGDDEGNTLETIRYYTFKIQAAIKSDRSSFEQLIEGELRLEFNEKFEADSIWLSLHSHELKDFLGSQPFSNAEFIKDTLEQEVFEYISNLPDVKGMATGSLVIDFPWSPSR